MKVTVVGAGAVGATCADNIARASLAEELVLLDIKEGLAEGKAQDMMQTAALSRNPVVRASRKTQLRPAQSPSARQSAYAHAKTKRPKLDDSQA